ncbi:rhodanese-like domain-containing protein [Persephonella sp.]
MKKLSKLDTFLILLIGAGFLYYLYIKGYIFANFENLSPKEIYQFIRKEDVIILDVRTPEEAETEGKIPASILIPLDSLRNNIKKLDKDKKIIVYCRSGNRSVSAARVLSSLGFKVYNMKGGINSWKSEGLPIE